MDKSILVPINNYFFDIFTLTSVTKSDSSFELDFVLKMISWNGCINFNVHFLLPTSNCEYPITLYQTGRGWFFIPITDKREMILDSWRKYYFWSEALNLTIFNKNGLKKFKIRYFVEKMHVVFLRNHPKKTYAVSKNFLNISVYWGTSILRRHWFFFNVSYDSINFLRKSFLLHR